MKVLVVGSGGREHAICYAFAKSRRVSKIFCAPGNAGIAEIAECVPFRADDVEALASFAGKNKIDLTFVGGESPQSLLCPRSEPSRTHVPFTLRSTALS